MKKNLILIVLLFGFFGSGIAQNASFKSLDNIAFSKIIKQKKTQVVDVRTSKEFAEGHLHRAINIDVNGKNFDQQINQLKKKKPVAVYCRSGKRSKIAASKLAEKGYVVYELDKGLARWNGEIIK